MANREQGTAVTSNRIQILPPEEARRIAAGEVIDRPASLIREFLDNAIDSGASNIEVSIDEGGRKKAEVADDGCGISREDLELCWQAHATSKIRSLDDLLRAETLGFRGEALAAAAAVAQLQIVSSTGEGPAWRLDVGPGEAKPPLISGVGRTRGTTVRALGLYDTIPARKRFLKREGTEAALCRQAFIEKALAFPWIAFRCNQDGRPKDFLPAAASKKDRFAAALLDLREKNFLHEIAVSGDGFSADLVIGGPELFRADRRMLYVFANGRRIQDYSLMQAMEYGVQGLFPNGTHPVGAVFLDIDPALADFNIHPAKREARFHDPGAIHHAVSKGLRDFFHHQGMQAGMQAGTNFHRAGDQSESLAMEALLGKAGDFAPLPVFSSVAGFGESAGPANAAIDGGETAEKAPVYGGIKFAGRAFGLFILIEKAEKLFIIDQHAAHERILYNRFLSEPIAKQELLVPVFFNTESAADDSFLELKRDELAKLAIVLERDGNGWRIDALPAGWKTADCETVREILNLRTAGENIAERWAATLCCHQAVRDGDYLDDAAAFALAKEALALPDPRCPHGRPLWTVVSREALYKAVRRN